jgi:hypothetical protein
MDVNFTEIFSFKQDRAWPHTENAELDMLNENSDNQVLSDPGLEMGDPGHNTLDVNPYNNFLWGFVKDKFTKAIYNQMKNINKKFQLL